MREYIPKISIIVPVYNAEKYLKGCIEAILNQSFQEFELIIIDDGSKDKSKKIIEEFSDEKIRFIQQKNSGVSKTRNKGIQIARGKYICFIDADDRVARRHLEVLYKQVENDVLQIGMCNYEIMYKRIPKEKIYEINNINFEKVGRIERFDILMNMGIGINIWTKIYSRKFLLDNKIVFNEKMTYDEDMFFSWKCILLAEEIGFVDEHTYYYRLSEESATMRGHDNLYEKYVMAFNEIRDIAVKEEKNNIRIDNQIKKYFSQKIDNMFLMILREKKTVSLKKREIEYLIKKCEDKVELKSKNVNEILIKIKYKNIRNKWARRIKSIYL